MNRPMFELDYAYTHDDFRPRRYWSFCARSFPNIHAHILSIVEKFKESCEELPEGHSCEHQSKGRSLFLVPNSKRPLNIIF